VEAYLDRARRRIRALDAAVAVLVLVSAALAFTLGMVLVDRWLVLSPLSRQLALAGFGLAAVLYLAFGLVVPLCRRINPYFAARHLEQVVPGAKNSVVNWLDLHGEPLPAAFRVAVSQRAARDLASADLDQAISGRRAAWLGGVTAVLTILAFVALAVLGARPFASLLGRTLTPFSEEPIATRTQLTLLQPEGGDATVPVGRSVRFAVAVDGRVPEPGKPDQVRLLFHYQPGDPYEERPLEREDADHWTTTLPAFQVQNGFWYKVGGGDAETPEYRVQVRATPLINGFEATYHYRPYLGWRDDTTHDPNLRALRGTEVTLVARTNRTVRLKDSRLELELSRGKETVKKAVAAEAVAGDPQALAFRLVLEESGKYRVWFTSTDGESNTDPMAYTIQVVQDHAPQVELTKPGRDVTLPANGLLALEGVATDDIGVKSLALHLRLANGAELQPHPYRGGKSFRLADGGYPKTLEYKDFVELDKVKDADGRPVALPPKTEVEYWLEAADDCDYHGPNVGRSKTFKVTIGEPEADQKRQEQERQKAKQEQKEHEGKQDEKLNKEGQNPRPDSNPDHAPQNQEQQGKGEGDKGDGQSKQSGQKGDKPGKEPKAGQQPDQQQDQGGKGGKPKEGANEGKEQDPREKQAEQLAKAIGKQQDQRGESKGEPSKESKGEKKDGGKPQGGKNPGQSKDAGQSGERKPDAGQAKDQGQGTGQQQPKAGEKKEGGSQGSAGADKRPEGAAKSEPQATPRGQSKDQGKQGATAGQEPAGKPKDGGPEQAGAGPKGASKPAQEKTAAGTAPGEAKDPDTAKKPSEASAQDVQRLAEKTREGDARQRQEAAKQLQQVAEQAKDSAAREAAKQAMEKLAQQQKESSPGSAKVQAKKPSANDASQNGPPCQCKGGSGGDKAGQSKGSGSGQGGGQKGASKGGSSAQTARAGSPPQNNEGSKDSGNSPGSAKGRPGEGQKNEPGEGGTGVGGTPGGDVAAGPRGNQGRTPDAVPPEQGPPEGKPGPGGPQRAGELVLEDLRKTLEELKKHPEEMKKVLDGAGLKEKDVRDVEEYLNEKLPPQQQGGSLTNIGARKVAPGKGGTSNAKANATAQPPPGWVHSTREFTRQLAEPEKE
jgi:hypothetical protein